VGFDTHTAIHCNTLQHAVINHSRVVFYQDTATHCNTLQSTATHCITLQHTAQHCNLPFKDSLLYTHCDTLQHSTAHCNTQSAVQGYCSVHTATHCNTLQHTVISHSRVRLSFIYILYTIYPRHVIHSKHKQYVNQYTKFTYRQESCGINSLYYIYTLHVTSLVCYALHTHTICDTMV